MKTLLRTTVVLLLFTSSLIAQNDSIVPDSLKAIAQTKVTSVKNQQQSSTCWSFATVSFLESEVLRNQGVNIDLSEMFFVYYTYMNKADRFIRLHGKSNLSPGGQAHDVIDVMRSYGVVPEEVFKGKAHKYAIHDHNELDYIVVGFLKSVLKGKRKKLSPQWKVAFEGILKAYLGDIPEKFKYKGKQYTPQEFQKNYLKLNPDDYIEFTSYKHHPYNSEFNLEVPDNWSGANYYNIELKDLVELVDYSLKNGYSIVWDGDVSEKSFNHKSSYATYEVAENDVLDERQETFDNQSSTDDHLMHLTGVFEDENGNKFYQIKNSWGTTSNECGGYLYMSETYFKIKTVAILVNKNGVPAKIKKDLSIQ